MPIEETFDPSSPEVVRASEFFAPIPNFPDVVVVTYSRTKLEAMLVAHDHEQIAMLNTSAMEIPIYVLEVGDKRIAAYLSTIGGPASAGIMEEVIAMGGKRFLFFGSCGSLVPDVTSGAIVLPTAAWRDEGVSYHYVAAADMIEVPTWTRLAEILDELEVPHHITKTWTTDAFYRETRATLQKRIESGCGVVEMECASTAAVAQLRGVEFYQFVYGGDSLAGEAWDIGTLKESLNDENRIIAELALQVAERL